MIQESVSLSILLGLFAMLIFWLTSLQVLWRENLRGLKSSGQSTSLLWRGILMSHIYGLAVISIASAVFSIALFVFVEEITIDRTMVTDLLIRILITWLFISYIIGVVVIKIPEPEGKLEKSDEKAK